RVITIDNRGRIVIPQLIRKSLGLTTNSQLMLVADSENKEIKITPIGLSDEKRPIKLRITMKDVPGALAKLAGTFGEQGLSMMYSEAVIIEKDKTAEWTVISESPDNLDELRKVLREKGEAIKVEVLPLE
ncbi:MAG: AbrB/MazE/SpoVT family DNA-binding domain-containing protein, partial [Candidatus Thorarchaeota archaeon]